jgi:hypothetical protein
VQVVVHPSPLVLEEELCARVAAAKAGNPLAPVLIVVPSSRLAAHVERRLVERFGVVVGVEILHHLALAERIVDTAGVSRPRVLSDALLDTLLASVVRKAPKGPLRDFVRDHPGAAVALRTTLTDLREAGVAPSDARKILGNERPELAGLYALWTDRLDALRPKGVTDDAGLAREAVPHAAAFASRYKAVFHHGAYDLIGVRVELVRALDAACEVTFLLPAHPTDSAGSFGVARARAIGGGSAAWHEVTRERPLPAASFFHTQGASAELATAAREALAAVADGTPPHEIAVVVRSFGPYAAAMDALLDAEGPTWHTSYQRPLRRDPAVARAWRAIDEAPAGPEQSLAAHAASMAALARGSMGEEGWNAPSGRAVSGLLDALRDVEILLDDSRAVPRHEALAWLDARIDAATLPPEGAGGPGIRVLDAMQARALTFDRVAIVGMNSGVFPRVGRDDPFLPDAARGPLAAATGRPVPLAAEGDGEEHLLLAMLMGSASRQLWVSWRRADEAGRPVVPSLALRDVARATGVGSDASAVGKAARTIPAHPWSRLEAWAREPGLLRRDEETLLVALESEKGAATGPVVAERRPDLATGVTLVEATDAFAPGDGAYDGRVGPGSAREKLAVTAIERLGACPLQFFFRDVLRVKAKPEPPTPFEADFAAVGVRVHDVLQRVYAGLLDERAFGSVALPTRIARARALLREAWAASACDEDTQRAAQWPVLDRISGGRWIDTLDAFLAADLTAMERAGLKPETLEGKVERVLDGALAGVVVGARLDRVLRGEGADVVGDYKTGGDLAKRVSATEMLKGRSLQVPVYSRLTGSAVELLGVGPNHVPSPVDTGDGRFARFDGFDDDAQQAGMLETLNVLGSLVSAGRFPIQPGDPCRYCDYKAACRRTHPPTLHREEHSPDVVDLRDCRKKSGKKPSLADVRGGRVS